MGQAENTKARLPFCPYQQKATSFPGFVLEQQSRKPRAIAVPLDAPGGCRFSHHWQH
jgi:hypothetical protein